MDALLRMKPGTALGGRADPEDGRKDFIERERSLDRERSMLSQVHLYPSASEVSSIPDNDIFGSKTTGRSMSGDLFDGVASDNGDDDDTFKISVFKQMLHQCEQSPGGTTTQSNPKLFSSDVANNYYNAMKVSRHENQGAKNKSTTPVFKSDAANSYYNAIRKDRQQSPLTPAARKQMVEKVTKKVTKKGSAPQRKKNDEKHLEEEVLRALSEAKTPEEVASYLLKDQENPDVCEVRSAKVYSAILDRQQQQQQKDCLKAEIESQNKQVGSVKTEMASQKKQDGSVKTEMISQKELDGSVKTEMASQKQQDSVKTEIASQKEQDNSVKTERVSQKKSTMAQEVAASTSDAPSIPPVTSFVCENKHPAILTSASTLTHEETTGNNKVRSSVKTGIEAPLRKKEGDDFDQLSVNSPTKQLPWHTEESGVEQDLQAFNDVVGSDGDSISHALRVTDVLSITGSSSVLSDAAVRGKNTARPNGKQDKKAQSNSASKMRSMSPFSFQKKKNDTPTRKERAEGGKKSLSVRSMSPASFLKSKKQDKNAVVVHSVKENKSDDEFTEASSVPSADTNPAMSDGERDERAAASRPSVATNKITLEPETPLISNRTKNDSRECIGDEAPKDKQESHKSPEEDDQSSVPAMAKARSGALPPRIPLRTVPPEPQEQIVTTSSDNDDGSVECSVISRPSVQGSVPSKGGTEDVDDKSSLDAEAGKEKNGEDGSKKTKKSKLALAKERYGKHRPISPTIFEENKEEKSQNGESTSDTANHSLSDDATTRSKQSKVSTKERLQKIMDYKSKSSPMPKKKVDQKTLDGWLVKKPKVKQAGTDGALVTTQEVVVKTTEIQEEKDIVETVNELQAKQLEDTKSAKLDGESSRGTLSEILNADESTTKGETERSNRGVSAEEETTNQQSRKMAILSITRTMSSGGLQDHPTIKLVKFNSPGDDDEGTKNEDVSLPPEIRNTKKIKIWDEDESLVTSNEKDKDGGPLGVMERVAVGQEMIREGCMAMCADVDDEATVGGTLADLTTIGEDNDTILEKTAGGESKRPDDDNSSVFACGVINPDLRREVAAEVKGVVHDIKGGIKSSFRMLFGACDITQDGGADVMRLNLSNTSDQLFGRKPFDQPRTGSSTAHGGAKVSNVNPQAEKMTSILRRKMNPSPVKQQAPAAAALSQKTCAVSEEKKKRLYLEKLKQVSLKHL